ncbi:gp066 [Rhodococcus phage ReqiPoco6]|uniref:Gp066 n=1 Tax=Rhodococcus phage ReqiPoco6 TaxID=691964 RepID=D4P7T4_9CAUD|nr:gp066 [Rhodococcus phage ReqiPoco6]ADD81064.1 gp066 [Rhodococcus phage ReqiPoco6]
MRPLRKDLVMTKLEMLKLAVSSIVGVGTSKIVRSIIANNVEIDSPVDQVTVTAGSFVVGAMVADASKDYTDAKIDEIVEIFKTIKETTKN